MESQIEQLEHLERVEKQEQPEPKPIVIATAESDDDQEHMMELSDKIFSLIVSSIQKRPETTAEALALVAYIYEKDIGPLLKKLRVWALSSLKAEIEELHEKIEAKMRSGWCVPKLKSST
jgi:dsDNA-binding SOS-regulon protein